MSEKISKDLAVTAIALASCFEARLEVEQKPEWEIYNASATASGTRYAMVEIAATVDEIFEALPGSGKDLMEGDVFYGFVLDRFYFPDDGSQPHLKGSIAEAVAFFVEEFGLEAPSLRRA